MFYPNNNLWSGSDYYIHVLKPTMELNEHTIYHIQNEFSILSKPAL